MQPPEAQRFLSLLKWFNPKQSAGL
jgi:hypothetical protein